MHMVLPVTTMPVLSEPRLPTRRCLFGCCWVERNVVFPSVKIFTFLIHLPWLPPSCGTIVKNHHIAQLTDYISQSERYFLRERPAAQIKPSQSTSNSLEIKGERDCPLLLMSRSRLAMKQNECRVVMIETA